MGSEHFVLWIQKPKVRSFGGADSMLTMVAGLRRPWQYLLAMILPAAT
jgi:hypothetical protein